MITINTALKPDVFKRVAEEEGLVFVKKSGMKLEFENPKGNDAQVAADLKKKLKATKELAAIFFQITT